MMNITCDGEEGDDDARQPVNDNNNNMILCSDDADDNILRNIERSIARFSDGNLNIPFVDDLPSTSTTPSQIDGTSFVDPTSSSIGDSGSGSGSGYGVGEQSIIRKYSPPGLEEAFQRLYTILFPSLTTSADGTTSHNGHARTERCSASSAAILMGPKGCGKSLILERCLEACKEQQRLRKTTFFRQVTINGIVCRGQDVGTVVYEIVRQLNEIAYNSSSLATTSTTPTTEARTTGDGDDEDKEEDELHEHKRRKRQRKDKHLLRLRKSSFTNNLALLESTLAVADADGVPILIVLDELDSFAEEGERQMLLYHFLDRVATPGSNLILVGITSSFSALSLLEKRIRSRAEGTAKVIYLRPPETYSELVQVIQHKLCDCYIRKDIIDSITATSEFISTDQDERTLQKSLHASQRRTTATLQRELAFGKDLRWFSRVISTALSLYHYDVAVGHGCYGDDDDHHDDKDDVNAATTKIIFDPDKHLVPALVMMGAAITDSTVVTKQPDVCVVNGVAVDARIQALLDMSKPQVALMLSAKRILARESHRGDNQIAAVPLKLERMFKEFQSFRRGSTTSATKMNTNTDLLMKAAIELLDRGLLVPSMDHGGGGPLQYIVSKVQVDLDVHSLLQLPLHVPFDIERELGTALELDLLDCSTALREWGKNMK